jgi:hypothetical protein
VVSQPEPELAIDLCLVARVGVVDDLGDVGQCGDDVTDLFAGEPLAAGAVLAQPGLGEGLLGLGLGDPLADDLWIAAGVEGGPVGGELPVAVGDGPAFGSLVRVVVGLGVNELVEGVFDPIGLEDGGEPPVEGWDDLVLA